MVPLIESGNFWNYRFADHTRTHKQNHIWRQARCLKRVYQYEFRVSVLISYQYGSSVGYHWNTTPDITAYVQVQEINMQRRGEVECDGRCNQISPLKNKVIAITSSVSGETLQETINHFVHGKQTPLLLYKLP